jgi:hypothetical protein
VSPDQPNPPAPAASAPQLTIPDPAQLRQEVADLSARIDAHLPGGAR